MGIIEIFGVVDVKYPQGIKAKFALINVQNGTCRFLVDNNHNHDSRYFHMHSELPHNPTARESLPIQDYREAMEFFIEHAKRLMDEEENAKQL